MERGEGEKLPFSSPPPPSPMGRPDTQATGLRAPFFGIMSVRHSGPVHTYPNVLESVTFSLRIRTSVHTYLVKPAYESATFSIRTSECKFLNKIMIPEKWSSKCRFF